MQYFKGRPPSRILMEASTVSEWVARLLEEVGHEVVVADPNYAPMYAQRSRRVKTDKRDALALADACKLGAYRPAHRTSEEQRHVRALLTVRDSLVRSRARLVTLSQAVLSRDGFRVPTGSSGCFGDRVGTLKLPELLWAEIASLLAALPSLNEQIEILDEKLGEVASPRRAREAADDDARDWAGDGGGLRGDAGRGAALPGRAPGGGLPGAGTAGVELE
jgi:transposase